MEAIVILQVDPGTATQIGTAIAAIPEIDWVYSVTGEIDLIALIRFADEVKMGAIVSDQILSLPGVRHSSTHLALQQFSDSQLREGLAWGD